MRDAHMRGSSTTGTIVVAALLALLIVPLFASCLVVEVHARGAESTHLLIPVPLNIARLAMRCIPAAEFDARMPAEVAARKEQILAALKAIEDAPDTTFVSVNAPDAKVMIGKRGDDLVLDITGDRDGTVKGTLPLAAVRRVLERSDWRRIHPVIALDVLAAAHRGTVLEVDSPDARVRIRRY
jgi:hypothetical protein